jgi:Secretion system C-terminal sorting domain
MDSIEKFYITNPFRVQNSDRVLRLPTAPLPTGITINANGTFIVPAGALPNYFVFFYKIVDNTTGLSSADISCTIQINSTFSVVNDVVTATAAPIGAITYNVLSNDFRINCATTGTTQTPLTLSNVHFTNGVDDPPFYSINQVTGAIQPNQPITSGTHLLQYTLCDNLYPLICQTATLIITVPATNKPGGISNNDNKVFNINEISISPNPTNDKIVVLFNTAISNDFKLELYDVLGRLLIEKQLPKDTLQYDLDLSNFSSTNYFIKLYSPINGAVFYKTIVKQ